MKFRIWKARVWMGAGALVYWRLDVPVSVAVYLDEECKIVRTEHATFGEAVGEMASVLKFVNRSIA